MMTYIEMHNILESLKDEYHYINIDFERECALVQRLSDKAIGYLWLWIPEFTPLYDLEH